MAVIDELRSVLAHEGVEPLWFEVPKSRKAPAAMKQAVREGADLVFVWGGDGTVQRCLDAVADEPVDVAILPAGTANLLATNLGVPTSTEDAVQVALHGSRRPLDVGAINGEHFAVMAGTGLDALMIRDADRGLKDRIGRRLAYVWTGVRNLRHAAARVTIDVDGAALVPRPGQLRAGGQPWARIIGGIDAFPEAEPDDGVLELGVVRAEGAVQWARVFGRHGRRAHRPLPRSPARRRPGGST